MSVIHLLSRRNPVSSSSLSLGGAGKAASRVFTLGVSAESLASRRGVGGKRGGIDVSDGLAGGWSMATAPSPHVPGPTSVGREWGMRHGSVGEKISSEESRGLAMFPCGVPARSGTEAEDQCEER